MKLVREISADFKTDLGFDQGTFELARGALEAYVVSLFENPNLNSKCVRYEPPRVSA